MPAATPCDHHRRRLVASDRSGRGLGGQRPLPVLCRPLRGVGGIDRDHGDPPPRAHPHQPLSELAGREPREQSPEAPAGPASAMPHLLPAGRIGEVHLLPLPRPARSPRSPPLGSGHLSPRSTAPSAPAGWSGGSDRVARLVQPPAGQVVGVEVDPDHPASVASRRSGTLTGCRLVQEAARNQRPFSSQLLYGGVPSGLP